jgi:hypothetical protein
MKKSKKENLKPNLSGKPINTAEQQQLAMRRTFVDPSLAGC